jgi:molecular chaperone GrpE
MSDEQRAGGDGTNGAEDPKIKVRDRRRFTAEGEAIPLEQDPGDAADAPGAEALPAPSDEPPPPSAPADPRDEAMVQQANRIDELTRAYASLVEEGKAARMRMEREKARVLEAERAQVAQALLEAVDALERALKAAGDVPGPLVEGVRLTLGVLEKKVAELGATRIAVTGRPFDPRLAEAVDLVAVADPAQDDMVVQEVQAGYRIGDRILRPARVRVGRLARA